MAKFEIPEALKHFFTDKKVQGAVIDLVGKLDGKDIFECDWLEAQDYNQALLFAAQVRADFVDLHYQIWEDTFGINNPSILGVEYFNAEENSPSYVWENEIVQRYYYRSGNIDENGRNDGLLVRAGGEKIKLNIIRFDGNDNIVNAEGLEEVKGWRSELIDDEFYLSNAAVDVKEFIHDPDALIEQFREDARRIIEALVSD